MNRKVLVVCILFIFIISLITIIYPSLISFITKRAIPDKLSEYGDMYGVLNPIISALAFGAFILSLFMQQEELRLQRKEMRIAIEESREQTKQFMAQVEISTDAQIKDEIYRMLSLAKQSSDSVSQIKTKRDNISNTTQFVTYTGNEAINDIYYTILVVLIKACSTQDLEKIIKNKNTIFEELLHDIASWLNNMLALLNYIIENCKHYSDIISYANRAMSICSIPHKFLLYLYAGSENPERGQQIRNFLISNNIIDKRILLPFMTNNDTILLFDNNLIEKSTINNIPFLIPNQK